MFDMKMSMKQDREGLHVTHTLYIDGKKTKNVHSVSYAGRHDCKALEYYLDQAEGAACVAFDSTIHQIVLQYQPHNVDAKTALADVEAIKIRKIGKGFNLHVTSRWLPTEKIYSIKQPQDLHVAVGVVMTLVTSNFGPASRIVYKMALNSRLSHLFAGKMVGVQRIINNACDLHLTQFISDPVLIKGADAIIAEVNSYL